MLLSEQDKQREFISALVARYGHERNALMPILQDVQAEYAHISSFAMQAIADALGIHPVEVHGVVSFYAFLSEKPLGKFVIRLCQTVSCDMVGKDRIARQLENELGVTFGETTKDGMFTLEWASCIGMCDQGPAMLVNDKVFTKVTPSMVREVIEECRKTFSISALLTTEDHH